MAYDYTTPSASIGEGRDPDPPRVQLRKWKNVEDSLDREEQPTPAKRSSSLEDEMAKARSSYHAAPEKYRKESSYLTAGSKCDQAKKPSAKWTDIDDGQFPKNKMPPPSTSESSSSDEDEGGKSHVSNANLGGGEAGYKTQYIDWLKKQKEDGGHEDKVSTSSSGSELSGKQTTASIGGGQLDHKEIKVLQDKRSISNRPSPIGNESSISSSSSSSTSSSTSESEFYFQQPDIVQHNKPNIPRKPTFLSHHPPASSTHVKPGSSSVTSDEEDQLALAKDLQATTSDGEDKSSHGMPVSVKLVQLAQLSNSKLTPPAAAAVEATVRSSSSSDDSTIHSSSSSNTLHANRVTPNITINKKNPPVSKTIADQPSDGASGPAFNRSPKSLDESVIPTMKFNYEPVYYDPDAVDEK